MNKIIVVDDDLSTRILMKRYLEKLGFEAILESSGDNVLSLVLKHQPVACIIDILMDGKEGMQTIFELSELPNPPKLIAFSQNAFYLGIADGFAIDDRLLKPVTPEMLQQSLQKLGIQASGIDKQLA